MWREHPHLKLLVVEDALVSNDPHIRLLEELDMRYVLGVKPGGLGEGFHWVDVTAATRTVEREPDGARFRFLNGVPLNDANFDLEVNFLECWEIHPDGQTLHFSGITNLEIADSNAVELMRTGRARWRIENETFNTLKNPGDGVRPPDDVGVSDRPNAVAVLLAVPGRLDKGGQFAPPAETAARGIPGVSHPGLGDPVPRHRVRAPQARSGALRHILTLLP